jgi:hypothetical protein
MPVSNYFFHTICIPLHNGTALLLVIDSNFQNTLNKTIFDTAHLADNLIKAFDSWNKTVCRTLASLAFLGSVFLETVACMKLVESTL